MYQQFYGLREPPFELTLDPRFLYLTPGHREVLSNLEYGLLSRKAVTVLTGEAGTGKTTVLRRVLTSDPCRHVRCVALSNPAMTRGEFLESLAFRFELGAAAAASKAAFLEALERLLLARRRRGEFTALIVDEAQTLTTELLEEIRLLANIETANEKLLSLVLVGQPALAERLNDPALWQFKQRVALRCRLRPLTFEETAGYIEARLTAAGGNASDMFTRGAVALIHRHSRGIPRTISVICDNALINGLALGCRTIDSSIVAEVASDFDLSGAVGDDAAAGRTLNRIVHQAHSVIADADLPLRAAVAETADPGANVADRELFGLVARPRRFAFFRS